MSLRTLEVAVCCSRAAASSRVRALTCSCRSARVEPAGRAADGPLLRFGFVVLRYRVFAGLRVMVFTSQSLGRRPTLPHRGVRCAPQQNSLSIVSYGHKPRSRSEPGGRSMSAVPPIASKFYAPQRQTPSAISSHSVGLPVDCEVGHGPPDRNLPFRVGCGVVLGPGGST
jgi:hypothetical protein